VELAPGQRRNLDVKLIPLCGMSGTVFGSDGAPVRGALIELLQAKHTAAGATILVTARTAGTNERGEYRLASVPAGRYIVKASAQIARDGATYLTRYYPAAGTAQDASVVRIAPGASEQSMALTLPSIAAVRLRLRLPREGREWAQFSAVSADAPLSRPQPLLIARNGPGEYATALQPGSWRIAAHVDVDGHDYRDVKVVAVEGPDQDVTFDPIPDVTLEGSLVVDSDSPLDPRTITIALDAADGIAWGTAALTARPAVDGRYRFDHVPAGDWSIGVTGLAGNAYVKGVQLANRHLPGTVLSVTQDTHGPLAIAISTRGAQVHGRVGDVDGGVLLVPEAGTAAQCRVAPVEPDGTFRITGLAPGEYAAYGVDSPDAELCFNRERTTARNVRIAVHLSEGDDAEITLARPR
jgi:hypothetical protein